MRVIAGSFKGRQLAAASTANLRPTTNRVKEAWASSLGSLSGGLEGLRVLDAFAGSGALGIELLSRGASYCLFCEWDGASLVALRQNLAALGLASDVAPIAKLDSFSADLLKRLKGASPLDVVILDPPYDLSPEKVKGLLRGLGRAGYVRNQTLISYEHDGRKPAALDGLVLCSACSPAALHLALSKSYGRIHLDYYRCH
ncbi:MAG: RsmD family RNA methyltransferase [Coriobacteriales bacterium]|jgi:16S rRNA (guanine966-N2)-methyltransferase|nr:RsmD family RNA methyltransferase [Coriobacteriales bacterium]